MIRHAEKESGRLMGFSWKIGYVDLNKSTADIETVPSEWRRRFLGGRGVNAYLSLKNLRKDPVLSKPENVIALGAGVLSGFGAGPLECAGFSTRFPLTDRYGFAAIPGGFGTGMRWAGFDHLIISGKAKHPVYLLLKDSGVQFLDARHLKGKSVSESIEMIRDEIKRSDFHAVAIGPAGENRVYFADAATEEGWRFGKTGAGAALGSKNIKAVVCCGIWDIPVKHPGKLLNLLKDIFDAMVASGVPDLIDKKRIGRDLRVYSITRALGMDFQTSLETLTWAAQLAKFDVLSKQTNMRPDISVSEKNDPTPFLMRIAAGKGSAAPWGWGPLKAAEKFGHESLKYFPSPEALLRIYAEEPFDPMDSRRWTLFFPDGGACKEGTSETRGKYNSEKQKRSPFQIHGRTLPAETVENLIANCLGIGTLRLSWDPAGEIHLKTFRNLVQFSVGLEFSETELVEIAFRTYAMEHLLNVREAARESVTPSIFKYFEGDDLKRFKALIKKMGPKSGWDKRSLFKKHVFKELQIEDLWPLKR